jgi:DNA-directed RNA polymerase subunit M/transcription elongation factor TFIIS
MNAGEWIGLMLVTMCIAAIVIMVVVSCVRTAFRFVRSSSLVVRHLFRIGQPGPTKSDVARFLIGTTIIVEVGILAFIFLRLDSAYRAMAARWGGGVSPADVVHWPVFCVAFFMVFLDAPLFLWIYHRWAENIRIGPTSFDNTFTVTSFHCPKCRRMLTGEDIRLGSDFTTCPGCGALVSLTSLDTGREEGREVGDRRRAVKNVGAQDNLQSSSNMPRCPRCGFSYRYDGHSCSHCGYNAS